MKLTDLEPKLYIASHAPSNELSMETAGALEFRCPNGCTDHDVVVPFKPWQNNGWDRAGDTLETLTLRPSIQVVAHCRWHGFITNGEVTSC